MSVERVTPTPEGRALGVEIARMADEAEREMLARHPEAPVRCGDCAFRAGTTPNGCAPSLVTALECLRTGEPFYCHLGVVEESFNGEVTSTEPTRVCAGFTAAMQQKERTVT